MSILPSYLTEVQQVQAGAAGTVEIPREYEINYNTGQLTGKVVEGIEAIKIWVWCCMRTQRFRYPIYSWDYGADLEQYVGQALPDEYLEVDLRDEIEEALKINRWITGIEDYSLFRSESHITIKFTIKTLLGNLEESYNLAA